MDADGTIPWQVPFDGAAGPARLIVTGGIVIVPMTTGASTGRIVAFIAPSDPRAPGRQPATGATPVPTTPVPTTPAVPGAHVARVIDTWVGPFAETPAPQPTVIALPALAPDGTLYAVDWFNNRILVLAPDGRVTWWGSTGSGPGQLSFEAVTQDDAPMDIAVSPDGQLIAVGEGGNHRVQLFDATGTSLRTIGRLGRGDSQFVNPAGVAVDGEHQIWVADTSRNDVQVFDEDGGFLFKFGSAGSGNGQLLQPGRPFVREDADEVLIPDFGNRRVAVFAKDGSFLRNYASDPGSGLFLAGVNGVIVDPFGRIIVNDLSGIHILDQDGHRIATVPLTIDGIGTLDPFGIALEASTGRLYVADPSEAHHLIAEVQLEPPLWPATP